jgi:hypothetical protein
MMKDQATEALEAHNKSHPEDHIEDPRKNLESHDWAKYTEIVNTNLKETIGTYTPPKVQ